MTDVRVAEHARVGATVFTFPDTVTEIRDRWAARIAVAHAGPMLLVVEQAGSDVEELARLLRSARTAALALDAQNDQLARHVEVQAAGQVAYRHAMTARLAALEAQLRDATAPVSA